MIFLLSFVAERHHLLQSLKASLFFTHMLTLAFSSSSDLSHSSFPLPHLYLFRTISKEYGHQSHPNYLYHLHPNHGHTNSHHPNFCRSVEIRSNLIQFTPSSRRMPLPMSAAADVNISEFPPATPAANAFWLLLSSWLWKLLPSSFRVLSFHPSTLF